MDLAFIRFILPDDAAASVLIPQLSTDPDFLFVDFLFHFGCFTSLPVFMRVCVDVSRRYPAVYHAN